MADEKKPRWQKVRRWGGLVAFLAFGFLWWAFGGDRHEGPGFVHLEPAPAHTVQTKNDRMADALPRGHQNVILFGDLHVHTTFSSDAFMMSLPLMGGDGARPPADACDFARFCSQLDFFALTDHAEALTPRHWRETKQSLRACQAVSGDEDPDVVAFVGWEWTQIGQTAETHYGHKNVIFPTLQDDELPARPIAARGLLHRSLNFDKTGIPLGLLATLPFREFSRRERYIEVAHFLHDISSLEECPAGVPVRDLPTDCREVADTPRDLFDKLDDWGYPAMVIPHGTTWGFYTPGGYVWDKQISPALDDPARQGLIEVMSGHGNSEEYRDYRAVNPDGSCPEPTPDHEPCCWRAGEIIRGRCGKADAAECDRRVAQARMDFLTMDIGGRRSVPGTQAEDWGDCGQCSDCYLPSFNHRPGGSAQYILAKGDFSTKEPVHQTLGFIASSDNHSARPGTGYKEFARASMTDAMGPTSEEWRDLVYGEPEPPADTSRVLDLNGLPPFLVVDLERQASFFTTGGLVAVHAEKRHRTAIWDALKRREVYGTSGDRILLWFDLVNGPSGVEHMGAQLSLDRAPRFRVRAVGAFEPKPGCPDWVGATLPAERLERLCFGECYHPSDKRRRITRIDVIRVRRQLDPAEPVGSLIEDPWKSFPCGDNVAGCSVDFGDPDFLKAGREVVYYVRAVQEPTLTINARNLRCQDTAEGEKCAPCYADWRNDRKNDCSAPASERAWSSPIFITPVSPAPGSGDQIEE
jgi:hypothetical protein